MITLSAFSGRDSFGWNVGWHVGSDSIREFFILEMADTASAKHTEQEPHTLGLFFVSL